MYRKHNSFIILFCLVCTAPVFAIEEAKFTRVLEEGKFEIRDYETYLLAEVIVEDEFEEVGNRAFRILFDYISGNNRAQKEIAMTAPVSQQAEGEEIAMTAPVSQMEREGGYAVSFMMPAIYTLNTLPEPIDEAIRIRQVPAHRMAVIRYSGTWSRKNYQQHRVQLEHWIASKGYSISGQTVWARYNSPFSLWFLRRNEVMIPIKAGS